jgi:hypothetical protein
MELKFNYDNRHYTLDFNSRVIQIAGDSAAGKSLMYQDLQHCMNRDAKFGSKVLLININSNKDLTAEQRKPYKYIVIDNADLIITPEIDEEIIESQKEGRNYWIIFGREPRGSVIGNSIGVLTRTMQDGQYYFKMDYNSR